MKRLKEPFLGLLLAFALSFSVALVFYVMTDGHAPTELQGESNKDY